MPNSPKVSRITSDYDLSAPWSVVTAIGEGMGIYHPMAMYAEASLKMVANQMGVFGITDEDLIWFHTAMNKIFIDYALIPDGADLFVDEEDVVLFNTIRRFFNAGRGYQWFREDVKAWLYPLCTCGEVLIGYEASKRFFLEDNRQCRHTNKLRELLSLVAEGQEINLAEREMRFWEAVCLFHQLEQSGFVSVTDSLEVTITEPGKQLLVGLKALLG